MRSRLFVCLILSTLLAAPGCRPKKPPATQADLPVETITAAPEAPAPAPGPAAPEPGPFDPLAGDLASVNEYLRQQGLLQDVYFDYDQATLKQEVRDQLARSARFLNDNPRFSVTLEGHCDERGTNEYNLALGERRATTVRDYLVSLGVDGSRLRTMSYGEERPACGDPDESCWRLNRRAHPVVTGRSGG
ncbi:MAG TPA: peptidoglycan-associated lipoprotein Pal [Thermoanaerobaculia bacterium]|nr:peptidoglycan-associated lipoprotein Pal [Thermoanaerobaculia bacterium]